MRTLKQILHLCLLLFIFQSCKPKNEVTIMGDIVGLPNGWAYLSYTYPIGSPPFDSVKVLKGKFEFKFKPDTLFQPQLITLSCRDSNRRQIDVAIANPYEPVKDGFTLYNAFIMEPGVTKITGDISQSKALSVNAGLQNEFYFKYFNLPFERVSHDPVKKKVQIKKFKRLLDDNPDAYWMFFAVDNSKFALDHIDLANLYDKFSDNIKQSYRGKRLHEFMNFQPVRKDNFPNNAFIDTNGKLNEVIDPAKKLNVIIFWASWCGPCRHEIPSLKRIESEVTSPQLRFVSISIDDNKNAWLKAVKEEKMGWQQLLVQPEKKTSAKAQYNLGFIPQIYVVNSKGIVVKKIDGFSDANETVVTNFLKHYVVSN